MDYAEHLAGRVTTPCVIAFASEPHRLEWGHFLGNLGVPHVLMKDGTERWYQQGVAGIGSRTDVMDYISELRTRYDLIITLGLSSGSYAALLYGDASSVDLVLMVSPITGKGEDVKPDFHPDWHHRIEHGPEHPSVPDLKAMMPRGPRVPVRAWVSDGDGTELDALMALRVGIPQRNIIQVPGHSHSKLARAIRDNGMLERMIMDTAR